MKERKRKRKKEEEKERMEIVCMCVCMYACTSVKEREKRKKWRNNEIYRDIIRYIDTIILHGDLSYTLLIQYSDLLPRWFSPRKEI